VEVGRGGPGQKLLVGLNIFALLENNLNNLIKQ
jgi:hypothetical protein